MNIQKNQYSSGTNVNFGVRTVLNKRFYTCPDKSPEALKNIIDTVEKQTQNIPGTLNLMDYFHSCHDIDPYSRHTTAFYEHGTFKDMVVLYDSENLDLWRCEDNKLINTLVGLAKIFQSREKTLAEEISPLERQIKLLQKQIEEMKINLNIRLQKHYREIGLPINYNGAMFGGESNSRSYLFVGDVDLEKMSGLCNRDKSEQECYLKQIANV